MVSDKIRERFKTLKECFRFLDTNHSQTISLNEFCQAIEHMRLKISFEDVKALFSYLDTAGKGEIGYDQFTFLLEERWRGIDPVSKQASGPRSTPEQSDYPPGIYVTEQDRVSRRNSGKIAPLRRS